MDMMSFTPEEVFWGSGEGGGQIGVHKIDTGKVDFPPLPD